MEELELGDGMGGNDSDVIRQIKETDEPFTSEPYQRGWSRKRYLAAMIGKSGRAVQGAWEYMDGNGGGIYRGTGHAIPELEGE